MKKELNNNNEVCFVRFKEARKQYNVSENTLRELAKEAGAMYKVHRAVFVDIVCLNRYIKTVGCIQ